MINDRNRRITNFYKILKANFEELEAKIALTVYGRDIHAHAQHIYKYPDFFSSVDQAWAVWVLSKSCFASKIGDSFGFDRNGKTATTFYNGQKNITYDLRDRIKSTCIENDDALSIIKRYDIAEAFHFVDPPYVGTDCGHYSGTFTEKSLSDLLDSLQNIKGKFMLTMFPNNKIEEKALVNKWYIHNIERVLTASNIKRRKQEEWIICNYNPSITDSFPQ